MIRVAFRCGDTRISARFLHWWQRADVSHCEAVLRQVDTVSDCASASLLDGGVRSKLMPLPADRWRVYELDADAAKALEWLDAHRGEGYDLLGLLGFAFRPFKGFFRLWWCSEAVAAMCGFAEPWRYDVATLESVCARIGRRVQ